MSFKKIIRELEKELQLNSNKENAFQMAKYMKNHFVYFGIKSPERKSISAPFIKTLSKDYGKNYWEITKILWKKEQREFQYIAMEILAKTKKHWDEKSIDLFKEIIIDKSWWDSIDFIASNLVGNFMLIFHSDDYSLMRKWNRNENMWIVRTSILFQLKLKEKTDWKLLQDNILAHGDSKEFFLRKAMGWALREFSKREGDLVEEFIEENHHLSGLTKREALKWLKNSRK